MSTELELTQSYLREGIPYAVIPTAIRDKIMARLNTAEERVRVLGKAIKEHRRLLLGDFPARSYADLSLWSVIEKEEV
jgi:hypothetical protein